MRVPAVLDSRTSEMVRRFRSFSVCSTAPGSSVFARIGITRTSESPSAIVRDTPAIRFERIVPQRDAAAAVDHTHALVERIDHFLAATLVVQASHVVVVGSQRERQRHCNDRQHFPRPVADQLGNAHRDAGADKVDRTIPQNPPRARLVDSLFREERPHDFRRQHFDKAVRDDSGADGRGLERPVEATERTAERQMHVAGGLSRRRHGDDGHQRAQVLVRVSQIVDGSSDGGRDRHKQRRVRAEDDE